MVSIPDEMLMAYADGELSEREAREAVHDACAHVGMAEGQTAPIDHNQIESVIRGALEALTRKSWAKAS